MNPIESEFRSLRRLTLIDYLLIEVSLLLTKDINSLLSRRMKSVIKNLKYSVTSLDLASTKMQYKTWLKISVAEEHPFLNAAMTNLKLFWKDWMSPSMIKTYTVSWKQPN